MVDVTLVSMSTTGTTLLGSIRLGCHGNWSRRGCVRSVFGYGYGWDRDGVLWMGGALSWEREQRAAKDNSFGIAAPYETKSLHETRGLRVGSLRSTVWVPELRGKGQYLFDISDIFFEECTIWGGA